MILEFTYYVHDNSDNSERTAWLCSETGLSEDEIIALDLGKPFDEVALVCTLDTETGQVTILGVWD